LRGNVLPIGGLTEKLLAAKRNAIKTVLIPKDNEIDLKEIQERVKEGMKIISISKIEEAIPYIFPQKKQNNLKLKKKSIGKKKKGK
jgi:ATP-dependent Lon protease